MTEYMEDSKKRARHECLSNAIALLTERRHCLTLARRSYVRDARSHIIDHGTSYDIEQASRLQETTIHDWERFFDGLLQTREPEELKVAYLAGPNPENDLAELMSLGVLPENVWAFESDTKTYNAAVTSALQSRFPFLKLFRGTTSAFLSLSPVRFDLVYLDFCGPMPSRSQTNLFTLATLLREHALNSPGILITNAAFPSKEQDAAGWSLLTRLVSAYLYPKEFLEAENGGGYSEGPLSYGLDPSEFQEQVEKDSGNYYGQFLTRLIMDIAGVIVPYQSFVTTPQVANIFFSDLHSSELDQDITRFYHFQEDGDGGDVVSDPGQYPLLWTIGALFPKRGAGDVNFPDFANSDSAFEKFSSLFLRQLHPDQQADKAVKALEKILFLLAESENAEKYLSSSMKTISSRRWTREMYQFCDLVLFHQIKELLIRQVAVPYHYNVQESMRWTYTAKEHRMFLDLSVLDEGRYVYDWMPTLDMLQAGMDSTERQFIFRFALDALNKHRRWYNTEYFQGTAVIGQHTANFDAKELKPRITIE